MYCDGDKNSDGLPSNYRSESFKEIHSICLLESSCNQACFESVVIVVNAWFDFEYPA